MRCLVLHPLDVPTLRWLVAAATKDGKAAVSLDPSTQRPKDPKTQGCGYELLQGVGQRARQLPVNPSVHLAFLSRSALFFLLAVTVRDRLTTCQPGWARVLCKPTRVMMHGPAVLGLASVSQSAWGWWLVPVAVMSGWPRMGR
ncbi:hypothetical protein RirG_031450 [Rhizophagus irregularis DAOM 197198w]|uniref:Uncharacterized protein n=1 Tax=Rhizophagus irregularis (strain DAOM 197198w) TaxID=1432141 RepID=A0A015LVB1_RHIIW|nr:hypothetical protein RirG_031450 [Rhizophagus irregularis DAOM 197198w]